MALALSCDAMAKSRTVPTPHDRLVRRVFSRPEAAAIILRRTLPERLLAWLDLSRIDVGSTTLIGPVLDTRYSDLFYSVGIRGSSQTLTIFIVLEHQSSPDPMIPLRMYWYVGSIWERFIASRGSRTRHIPLVIPIVMEQQRSSRHGPTRLSDMFALPEALREVLDVPVELKVYVDDMGESVLDDPVADRRVLALVELSRALLFGYHHPESFTDERVELLADLFDIVLAHAPEDARALWTYVVNVYAEDSPVRAMLLRAVGKDNQQMCATIREAWVAEGMAKGMTEGMAKGMADGVVKGVNQGLANALLTLLEHRQLTPSPAVRERVLAASDRSTLQGWFERALSAQTIEQVFDAGSSS